MSKNLAFSSFFSDYRSRAKQRGLFFDLSESEFRDLTSSSCYYCGINPKRSQSRWNRKKRAIDYYCYNGLDRVDNNVGYTPENVLSCCTECNMMKRTMSIEEFFDQVRKIYQYRINTPADPIQRVEKWNYKDNPIKWEDQ